MFKPSVTYKMKGGGSTKKLLVAFCESFHCEMYCMKVSLSVKKDSGYISIKTLVTTSFRRILSIPPRKGVCGACHRGGECSFAILSGAQRSKSKDLPCRGGGDFSTAFALAHFAQNDSDGCMKKDG